MADRHNTQSARRIDALNKSDLNRLTIQKPRLSDDVLTALANAPENRRARQVSEWERLRRQSFRAAAR
ncbi:MAG: hypothetical protein IPM59_00530 [Chloracidobacterium sp.]|nr:hypothetical protein [Chloracidobacterium sp.]